MTKKAKRNSPNRIFCDKLRAIIKREKLALQPLSRELGFTDKSLSNIMWSGSLSRRTHDALVARFPELKDVVPVEKLYGSKSAPLPIPQRRMLARGPRRPRPVPFEVRAGQEHKLVPEGINVNDAFVLGATLTNLAHQKSGQLWIEGLETAVHMGLDLRSVVSQLKGSRHAG